MYFGHGRVSIKLLRTGERIQLHGATGLVLGDFTNDGS